MPSLLSAVESVRSGTKEAPGTEIMLDGDKVKKAYELKLKGVPIKNIANAFHVSVATIYRWVKQYEQEFARQFVSRPRSDVLMESLAFLRTVRDTAMKEVHQIDLDCQEVGPDGKIRTTGKPDRIAKFRMLNTAMTAEKTSVDMLIKTGVLPNAVKEIHHSVEDTRPSDSMLDGNQPATREEALKKLTDLIVNERRMPEYSDED